MAAEEELIETRTRAAAGRGREVLIGAIIIAIAIVAASWMSKRSHTITFDKPYQAVLLSNGQVYYGRLDGYGTDAPVLREVYYVQSVVNPQTKEATNILQKRGREWRPPCN